MVLKHFLKILLNDIKKISTRVTNKTDIDLFVKYFHDIFTMFL